MKWAVVLAVVVLTVMALRDPHAPRAVVACAGVGPVVMAAVLWAARIRRYRLAGDELLVELRFRAARFPLAGLVSASALGRAPLATVVGVLVEVPVMLSVVKIVNATRGWYEAGVRHSSP